MLVCEATSSVINFYCSRTSFSLQTGSMRIEARCPTIARFYLLFFNTIHCLLLEERRSHMLKHCVRAQVRTDRTDNNGEIPSTPNTDFKMGEQLWKTYNRTEKSYRGIAVGTCPWGPGISMILQTPRFFPRTQFSHWTVGCKWWYEPKFPQTHTHTDRHAHTKPLNLQQGWLIRTSVFGDIECCRSRIKYIGSLDSLNNHSWSTFLYNLISLEQLGKSS